MRDLGEVDMRTNTGNPKPRAVTLVLLMLFSTWGLMIDGETYDEPERVVLLAPQEPAYGQTIDQSAWWGEPTDASSASRYLQDRMMAGNFYDPGIQMGIITDLDLLAHQERIFGTMLEEPARGDHDNDGIDDLNDLDDDNDGIYDLIERFDGCYGTDPYDHDNDGILDHLDWDDDNDGILEGPLDYDALEALGYDPRNVTTHRFLDATIVHPWTNTPVGQGYLADQNPFDHDNDGVADEDPDGSGPLSYDEDDDNDGRIDQFKWPCDFDGDGVQDYLDADDDGDGIDDVLDAHPYDRDNTSLMASEATLYDAAAPLTFNDYRVASHGLDFVALERARVDADDANGDGSSGTPAFSSVIDGDLDGDSLPNFIDPDQDGDGTPNSADNDDDNDGLLDMYDPDDDNDGIPDACMNLDTNGDDISDMTGVNTTPYQTPGGDTDGVAGTDCEIDYDGDLDNDRWRPFDQNYNGIWDWLDSDLGGTTTPDTPPNTQFDPTDFPWDIDDDQIENEVDAFPLNSSAEVATWNCPTLNNPNPVSPDQRCNTMRASYAGFNDWDGDGISNWDDIDDDNDGIIDPLDIDPDCDLDNDGLLHQINGAQYRDDGPNDVDSDVDGDGLENDIDWDDDNDGIADIFDPDDGNCGTVDFDQSDAFTSPWYPVGDGAAIDGSTDQQAYAQNSSDHWNMVFLLNPFEDVLIDYNGYDETTNPVTSGLVPEFYWFLYSRWSSYNGGNEFDIDSDGDSMINGLDPDQDADGLPDWWDQDEANDGILDVDDPKMGGTLDMDQCGYTAGSYQLGFICGYLYAAVRGMPLNGNNAQFGTPFSTRPDPDWDQGAFGQVTDQWRCTPGASGGCYHYDFASDGTPDSALSHQQMVDNRDAFLVWVALNFRLWNWNNDNGAEPNFPDEVGADVVNNDVDGDLDGDGTNNTIDIEDDADAVYDWFDVDDDNDGIWDFFEVDTDDDLDNDDGQLNGNFFSGTNCEDNDDDGNDADVDGDGWFQAVWDRGVMTQGLDVPQYYDVDNDNDGVPDAEDWDDDNNGHHDIDQDAFPGCFVGEEAHPWDHDNDGIPDMTDDDWDADGINNTVELAISILRAFDHDNDGLRDDLDEDDDQDGMHDFDEVMLWPERFDRPSTNPWDHDDFGGGEAIANALDPRTGPDAIDEDDDNDTRADADHDVLEEGFTSDACSNGNQSSDWDNDNDCIPDADDKAPTFITLDLPNNLWLDSSVPAIFTGNVQWVNPVSDVLEPAPEIPVKVTVEWASNNTTVFETTNVLTRSDGNFTVPQFLCREFQPCVIPVGDNTTYNVYAEVTEMFVFNGNKSATYPIAVQANLTVDYSAWRYFRSDEQPFWLDFKAHYSADWDRGLYDNRIVHAPITLEIYDSNEVFGNITNPTVFDGFGNAGYRADDRGWASLTFVQDVGANGIWKQVRFNSTLENGQGELPGGYEEIAWNNITKQHDVVTDSMGGTVRYNYTNTSLPTGDITIVASVEPNLASEWPFPHLNGDRSDPFSVRVMHRMYVEGEMIVEGTNPLYYFDQTINNGDGTFGAWATLFHAPALQAASISFAEARAYKPHPTLWDGQLDSLTGEAARLRPFLRANVSHWFIALTNGGDSNLPPCGQVDITDPDSPIRCEIVPEMDTGDTFRITGTVRNRTLDAWDQDPMALQVDVDGNGIFLGTQETAFTRRPVMQDGDARFDYNWTWFSQYGARTYGVRVDFTNSAYYFTGNSTVLSSPGAYINVSVVGTTEFQMNTLPRLYRGTTTAVEARLLDNSLQPVREVPVNWTWNFDGRSGTNFTDSNGVVRIDFEINQTDDLGNYTLEFEFADTAQLKGSTEAVSVWVISRTSVAVSDTSSVAPSPPGITETPFKRSGDLWDFTAVVTDDNATPFERNDGGLALDGPIAPTGGLVDVIYEGQDFEGVFHRQIVATLAPSAGVISLPEREQDDRHLCVYDGNGDGVPDRDDTINGGDGDGVLEPLEAVNCLKANVHPLNPALLRADPESFLPDGFGPVSVILRFHEDLPNEGCEALDIQYLDFQGPWDPCTQVAGSENYRRVLPYNANGFSLLGGTTVTVDDQIVYTSEIDPLTGESRPKPMTVTGNLTDELGTPMAGREIGVQYRMDNDPNFRSCGATFTDSEGRYSAVCPLSNVAAGEATVRVEYSRFDNANDAYRYNNDTVETIFPVFSNSTLRITRVGPGQSLVKDFTFPNGTNYDVVYLKEHFHIRANLTQSNGVTVGGKCLNIYLDPAENIRPIATVRTSELDGTINWFSGDVNQNPTLRNIETTGGKKEGLRTLRVAFEPDRDVNGGCDADSENVLNGSYVDQVVLVQSRTEFRISENWARTGANAVRTGTAVTGEVILLRSFMQLGIENEEVVFLHQFWNGSAWITDFTNESRTNEQGAAGFTFEYPGTACAGGEVSCDGRWRTVATFAGSDRFQSPDSNISREYALNSAPIIEQASGFFGSTMMSLSALIVLMSALIGGVIYYQRSLARRQVEALRGILTDTMLQLQASNEFIAIIFDCYKNLIREFKKRGFMKKVYETTREFEMAVRQGFTMVPSDQIDAFLTIFEEARYSDHDIDASHRDRALATLSAITSSLDAALGEGQTVQRGTGVNLYDVNVKAGTFTSADGTVIVQGKDDGDQDNFSI